MTRRPTVPASSVGRTTRTTRTALAGLATLALTALTACGSDDGDATETTVTGSDTVTGDLPRFDDPAAIRDALAGTGRECLQWSDVSAGLASCVLPGTGPAVAGPGTAPTDAADRPSIHGVYVRDNPGEIASTLFQDGSGTPAVVIGNNWLFDCGPGDGFGIDNCTDVAEILGGTVVLPEPV